MNSILQIKKVAGAAPQTIIDAVPQVSSGIASQLNNIGIAAPKQQNMERGDALDILSSHNGLILKSVYPENCCCGQCLDCCPPLDFTIEPKTNILQNLVQFSRNNQEEDNAIMYSSEDSLCLCRYCLCGKRKFTQRFTLGNKPGGEQLMELQASANCGASPCTCCCTPKMKMYDSKGEKLGRASIPCYHYCADPNVVVRDANGDKEYDVQMGMCCFGFCPDFSRGLCNYVFHIYPHEEKGKRKVGAVVTKRCCTSFEVDFPQNSSSQQRARLLGATMLINMLFLDQRSDYLTSCVCGGA